MENRLWDETAIEELSTEWAGYLTDEQYETIQVIADQITQEQSFQFHLVLGVAGTGKTQVLLSLAQELRDRGLSVVIEMSDELIRYLSRSGIPVVSDKDESGAIYLYDDPKSLRLLKNRYIRWRDKNARAVVVALDPFQLLDRNGLLKIAQYLQPELQEEEVRKHSKIRKDIYNDVIMDVPPRVHWLKTVYRQRANLGSQVLELSKRIFTTNRSYFKLEKQLEWSRTTKKIFEGAMNEMLFTLDGGLVDIIETKDWLKELHIAMYKNYANNKGRLRNPAFLLVVEPGFRFFTIENDVLPFQLTETEIQEII